MGTTKHCYIQNIEALGLLVSEKKIFLVFPIVSLWRLSTPGAWPNLNIQNSSGPCGFREEDFLFFPHSKSMETINPRGVAKFDPRGMNGTIYVEDH